VVIEATRVVYSAAVAQREVRISNEDDFPNLVQVWVDSGDPESRPDAHDERFFITPPVFRMEPKSGQSLRLRYLENDLPKDRESLFYLNVLQVPPVSSDQQDNNKVLVMIRNRLKLFYRPETIHADPATAGDAIEFQIQKRDLGYVLVASNPSPFFITLTGLKLSSETADYTVDSRWWLHSPAKCGWLTIPRLRIRVKFPFAISGLMITARAAPELRTCKGELSCASQGDCFC